MTIEGDSKFTTITQDSLHVACPAPKKLSTLVPPTDFDLPRARSTPPSPNHMHHSTGSSLDLSLNTTEWSRKKFHDLRTYGCAGLLMQSEDINTCDSEDLEQISCMEHRVHYSLSEKRRLSAEDLKLYRLFSELFDTSYEKAKTTVVKLQEKFLSAFYADAKPTYDPETKTVTLNYDQLEFAQELIKQEYPGFFSLSQTPKQNRQVAHITQLLIVGGIAEELPQNAEAFEIREIGSKWSNVGFESQSVEQRYQLLARVENSDRINTHCRNAVDVLLNEFIRGKNILEICEYSTKELTPENRTLSSFLTYFAETVVNHIRKVEKKHPGRAELDLKYLCQNLSNTFATSEIPTEIIEEAFLYFHPDETASLTLQRVDGLPVDAVLMQQLIHLKFVEFCLFLKSNLQGSIHEELSTFYNDYTVRAKVGEKGIHAQFKPTHSHLCFDSSLKPTKFETHHTMSFSSQTTQMMGVSENYGGDVSVGKIVSSVEFNDSANAAFYLHNPITTTSSTFKQCLWNWRTPERLIEHTLEKICPEYYGNSLKKQLNSFVCKLKQLEKIKKGDLLSVSEKFDVTVYPERRQGWFSSFWSSSDPESEQASIAIDTDDILAERIQCLINEGICLYNEYSRRQKLLRGSGRDPSLMISYQLAKLLDGVKNGLNEYISTQISKGHTEVKNTFTPLVQWINTEVLPKLPSQSTHIEGYHQPRSVLSSIKHGVLESTNGHDIEWKVIRYQSILRQLRIGISEILSDSYKYRDLESPVDHFLTREFENPGMLLLQELVSDLFYNIDLSTKDPEQFTQYYLKCLRKAYSEKFIKKLRSCSDALGVQSHILGLNCVRKICHFLYTSVDLEPECLALNQKFYDLGKQLLDRDPTLSLSDEESDSYLLERIDTLHYFFHEVGSNHKTPEIKKWLKSLKDHWNIAFDPNTEGNLPHKLGEILISDGENQKRTSSIACGSTTVEGWISYAQNNQEFHRCMEQYREEGKRHVFVINQDLREGSWLKRLKGGVETDRINAILGISEGLEDTFFPIVLSKNSNFFRQIGEFEHLSNAQSFKEELYNQHFVIPPSISGNFIPPHVMDKVPGIEEQSKIWIELIHTIMFYGKPELSVEERQIFYDIYQDILVTYLIVNLNADSYNISCRDAIDRAADSNSRLWVHLGLVHDMEKEPLFRQRYEALLLSRAIMTRKRETILERVDRNKQAVSHYESHKKALQKLHRAIFKEVSIKPVNPVA